MSQDKFEKSEELLTDLEGDETNFEDFRYVSNTCSDSFKKYEELTYKFDKLNNYLDGVKQELEEMKVLIAETEEIFLSFESRTEVVTDEAKPDVAINKNTIEVQIDILRERLTKAELKIANIKKIVLNENILDLNLDSLGDEERQRLEDIHLDEV